MDNRISPQRPVGPIHSRKLGDQSSRRERDFVLPRHSDAEDEVEEAEADAEFDVLSPQPRRNGAAVSRVRLEDEAGQRIDLRG